MQLRASDHGTTLPWWQPAIFLALLLITTACSSAFSEPTAVLPVSQVRATPTAVADPHPPLVAVAGTAVHLPEFAPPTPGQMMPSEPAVEAQTPLAGEEPTVTSVSEVPREATITTAPTFTPPAQPGSSPYEHYWLHRPVPAGGVVWTDKAYPYGSTRGGQLRPHHGVEFNVPYNSEVLAAATGTVRVAGDDSVNMYGPHTDFYGKLIVIEHEFQVNGLPVFSLYGHLNDVLVVEGQRVEAQSVIGVSGATGVADGPHLHFEVRVGQNNYESTRNPLLWLNPFPDRGTIAGRVLWPNGELAEGAPVSLDRVDGLSPYYATTTYAGQSVNPDHGWNENFAIDDVLAGYYKVVVKSGSETVSAETWVYPRRTAFLEIVLE